MTDPATTPTTQAEDPRDRRRRRTALICATVSAGVTCFLLGALTHSFDAFYSSAAPWIGMITIASVTGLLAYITSSTKDAVGQLLELIIARIKAIAEETRTAIGSVVREALRDEVREQLTGPGKEIAGRLGRIQDRVYARPDDDPGKAITEPIRYEQPIQHVVGVAPVGGGVYGGRVEAVVNQALERFLDSEAFNERVQEFGQQKYYNGYAAGREDDSTGGAVVALQPRNGRAST